MIEKFIKRKNKIIIFGDSILDRYIIGDIDRISPEAPVPVLNQKINDYRLGGSANVACNLLNLNCEPILLSIIGDDYYGKLFTSQLEKCGIDSTNIIEFKNRRTTTKTRIISRNQQILRVDSEDISDISNLEINLLLNRFKKIIEQNEIDAVVFQDYNKGMLTQKIIHEALWICNKYDITTFADPKDKNFFEYKDVDFFKPNLKEVLNKVEIEISTIEPSVELLYQADKIIKKKINNKCSIITLGDKGIFYSYGNNYEIIPTTSIQVVDVCGAGDTVLSVLVKSVISGNDITNSIKLANKAGSIVCQKTGVVSVKMEELF